MDLSGFADRLERVGISVLREAPMSRHTSFKIGGPVDVMVLPKSCEEVKTVMGELSLAGEEPLIIGNGTNLLVTDSPLHRVVVKTYNGLGAISAGGETEVVAGSGAMMSRVAVSAMERGLAGMEFAHGIPGTMGGAIAMNAGAYGGQMANIVDSVNFIDEEGNVQCRKKDELDFSYRHSVFSGNKYVILAATLRLERGDRGTIKKKMDELMHKRRESQPLEMASAGSTFKRPPKGYAAALIEQAGLKGYTAGDAQVSQKHSGFVVNLGGASFDDVRKVMDHVTDTVYARFGIMLEREVRVIEA